MHVRYLLSELEVRGDLHFLATALLAPLEMVVLAVRSASPGLGYSSSASFGGGLVTIVLPIPTPAASGGSAPPPR